MNIINNKDKACKIFISSTSCLKKYRDSAKDCIIRYEYTPIYQDQFSASPNRVEDELPNYINNTDILLIIAGNRYGSTSKSGISYVELEYELATKKDIPIIVLIYKDIEFTSRDPKQELFINKLLSEKMCGKFHDMLSFEKEINKLIFSIYKNRAKEREQEYINKINWLEKEIKNQKDILTREKEKVEKNQCVYLSIKNIKESIMNTQYDELKKIIDLITHDWENYPILLDFVDSKIKNVASEISFLIKPEGYSPINHEELVLIINKLFSNSLETLKATSIHSSKKELELFNTYWNDPVVGKFFISKNQDFLKEGGKIERLFFCDSLIRSVKEEWFNNIVMAQISNKVKVKIQEINEESIEMYEDFGIYEHKNFNDVSEKYILFAPRDLNAGNVLSTKLISEPKTAADYIKNFQLHWDKSEHLEIVEDDILKRIYNIELHGEGVLNEIFDGNFILRNMIPLNNTKKRLIDKKGFVRKYQLEYAKSVLNYIEEVFSNTKNILYFGDTSDNDGGVIRNLQKLGVDISGFICDPSLKLNNVWFNSIYFTSRWTDVLGFVNKFKDNLSKNTLIIYDIDQTLWAPKGLHEKPLNNARISAINALISYYINEDHTDFVHKAKERAMFVYNVINSPAFHDITKDNEDYKAAIAIFMGLGFYKGGIKESVSAPKDIYVEGILNPYLKIDNGIYEFMREVFSEALWNPKSEHYCKGHGIFVERVSNDIRELSFNIQNNVPAPFTKFRSFEFNETFLRANDQNLSLDNKLTINKTMWDMAQFFKNNELNLLGLSDRPDEATYDNNRSLLNMKMQIRGMSIESDLKAIDFKNL